MPAIPAVAVARLRRLEQRVESWRAAYADLQDAYQHSRSEAARLEGMLQGVAGGRRLEVDEKGGVFTREGRGGTTVRRTVGLVSTPDPAHEPREVFRYYDEPAVTARGRAIARLRREAADLAARRDALAEKMHPVAQLADACRAELLSRGWQEGEYAAVQQGTALSVRGAA